MVPKVQLEWEKRTDQKPFSYYYVYNQLWISFPQKHTSQQEVTQMVYKHVQVR